MTDFEASRETAPLKMRGIVAEAEDGSLVANMGHPNVLPGVELPAEALCTVKTYPNDGARTRITKLHVPGLIVEKGDAVVALVDTQTEQTGRMVDNPGYWKSWDAPRRIPETTVIGATAVRWGVVPK
ncbi:MAG TPA: hypothetical protein VJC09_02515 [Candidatus Saccharimonadales bacterium]|nr:hypothetical protein [Candidatus Saccharimonadales bacterium]